VPIVRLVDPSRHEPGASRMPRRPARAALRALVATLLVATGSALPTGPAAAQGPLVPLTTDQVSHRLAREVYGFLPYWEIDAGIETYLRYDLLSTIAFFGVGTRSDGSLDTATSGYRAYVSDRATRIIEQAHAAGVRTAITFQSFGTAKNAAFFSNAAAQATFVQQAVALMTLRGADGANIDVEGLETTYFGAFGALTGALRQAALAVNPNAEITVATNANTSGARMAAAAIANGADRVFLMGYNYRTAGSSPVGSIDPLVRAGGGLSLSTSLDLYASYGVPLERVHLGIGYYGRTWPTVTADLRAARQTNTTLYGSSSIFYPSSLPASAAGATFDYDPIEQSARLVRFDDARGTWIQTYYNDPATLATKIALTNARSLAGMGIWALGYDRDQPGYWEAIATAYAAARLTSVTVSAAPSAAPTPAVPAPTPTPVDPAASPDPNATPTPPAAAPAVFAPTVAPPPGITRTTSVVVSATWADGGTPSTEIHLSNDGLTWGPWQPIAPVVPWALADGGPDGLRTVLVQVRSTTGAMSPVASGRIVLDRAAPIVSIPTVAPVARATAGTTDLPVRVAWNGSDATTSVAGYALESSVDGAPYAVVARPAPAATTAGVRLSLGRTYRFRVTAVDVAGNVGAPVEGSTVKAAATQDRASAVRYSTGWRRAASSSASGGTVSWATATGATATFRFTGTSIAILAPIGSSRGSARVLIDGVAAGTFSEYATAGRSRQVVYARSLAAGPHTLQLRVAGTRGHPRVDVDAFVVVR